MNSADNSSNEGTLNLGGQHAIVLYRIWKANYPRQDDIVRVGDIVGLAEINEHYAGLLGHYCPGLDPAYNKRVVEANKLVDEYNSHVYDYKTAEDQMRYQYRMVQKARDILNDEPTYYTEEDLKRAFFEGGKYGAYDSFEAYKNSPHFKITKTKS